MKTKNESIPVVKAWMTKNWSGEIVEGKAIVLEGFQKESYYEPTKTNLFYNPQKAAWAPVDKKHLHLDFENARKKAKEELLDYKRYYEEEISKYQKALGEINQALSNWD